MMALADYIGIPFREMGRDRSGVDCYGLVRLVLAEVFGVATGDYSDYKIARQHDCAKLIRRESESPEWIAVKHPQAGDVVLLRLLGHPMHCGVFDGEGNMLHASEHNGVCLERLNSPAWSRRISGFYRHRELLRRG